jgi:hypothetical protein
LPPWKAFVVQLTNDTTPDSGTVAGRVEHLGSGRRERFSSGKELLATLLRLLERPNPEGKAHEKTGHPRRQCGRSLFFRSEGSLNEQLWEKS